MKPPHVGPRFIGDRVRDLLPHLPNKEIATQVNCGVKYVQQCRRKPALSRPPRPGGWSDERIAEVKRLWAAGFSANQIAARIGSVSRNAVIGKLHRLGLAGRVTVRKQPNAAIGLNSKINAKLKAKAKVGAPKPISPAAEVIKAMKRDGLPIPTPAETDRPRVATMDLEPEHCRWPCRDDVRGLSPDDPIFCGAKKVPNTSYCAPHLVRSTSAPQPRRREPVLHVVGKEEVAA